MKVGYSQWGYLLGERRLLADGLLARGHDLVLLQPDRDLTDTGRRLPYRWDVGHPHLDVLVLQWCPPVPGRNTTWCGAAGHTCELHRQTDLVDWYLHARQVPTVILDDGRHLPTGSALRAHPAVTVCGPGPEHPLGAVDTLLHPAAAGR